MSLIVDSVGKVEDIAFETFELISLLLSAGDATDHASFLPLLPSVRQRPDCWFCPLRSVVAVRDIFMRSCETSNSSIRGGSLPSSTSISHLTAAPHESQETDAAIAAAASGDRLLTTRIPPLSSANSARDPIRSLFSAN